MNAGDDAHECCAQWIETVSDRDLLLPVPVLTEVCQLLEKDQGPHLEAEFLRLLADSPQFKLWMPDTSSVSRMAVLVEQYADFPLGAADSAVIAAAEQSGTHEIATLDRRHFRAVRPVHVAYFELHPSTYPG